MISKPKLSVMMANYNYGQYIREALEAILTQTYAPMEVIVVDDGSTDNSVAIIQEFMRKYSNLRLLQNERNMGGLYSINRCLKETTGDYVYSAASDDKVLPGLFEKSMNLLIKYPQAGLCCSDIAILNTGYDVFEKKLYLNDEACFISPSEVVDLFMKEAFTPVMPNTVIIKRAALLEAGGYIPDLKWSCDTFVHHVVCFRYGMCYIPETLALVRRHPIQWGSTMSRKQNLEREVVKNIIGVLKNTKYQDVYPMFKRTVPFSSQPWEALCAVVSNRKYWDFLSIKLMRYALFDKFIKWPIQLLFPQPFIILCHKILNKIRQLKYIFREICKKIYKIAKTIDKG